MICRADLRLILAAGAVLALVPPAVASPGHDPLAVAAEALDRGDGIAAEVAAGRAFGGRLHARAGRGIRR